MWLYYDPVLIPHQTSGANHALQSCHAQQEVQYFAFNNLCSPHVDGHQLPIDVIPFTDTKKKHF